nr:GTP-sensing pleiotropic transcriptional regulator CodY [Lachnospiraceae bacterium]
ILYRLDPVFSIDDIILAEYGATMIALAMQRALSEEQSEEQHKEADMEVAVRTLTKLEGKAMLYILEELDGRAKGTLIASRLADQVGITRSVIVNALKKCESAGVIQTRSSGVKGTSIQVLNELFTSEMILQNMN